MAYAKLIFPAGLTAVKKLKDIARFCAGATSLSSFEFIDSVNSEIVVTEPHGWSIVSSISSLEAVGAATKAEYCLQSTSVGGKTIYCALSTKNTAVTPQLWGAGTPYDYPRPGASSTDACLIAAIGTDIDVGNSTIQNKSWDMQGFITNVAGTYYFMTAANGAGAYLNANVYYIRVTKSGLIIVSQGIDSNTSFTSVLEFPETEHTLRTGNLPYLSFSACACNVDSFYSAGSFSWTDNACTTGRPNANAANFVLDMNAQFTNWRQANGGLTKFTPAVWNLSNVNARYSYDCVNSPSLTITSTGQSAYSLVPIIGNRSLVNEGVHDYSTLSKLYQTFWSSGDYTNGNELTVGSDTYVLFVSNRASANPRASYARQFAMKKS